MLQLSDKVGNASPTVGRMRHLNDFLKYTKSIDAYVQGRVFTWKIFLPGQLVYEKLDRLIFSEDCALLFPNYLVSNGPFTCLDRAFVLLDTDPAHQPITGTNFNISIRGFIIKKPIVLSKGIGNPEYLGPQCIVSYKNLKRLIWILNRGKATFDNFKSKLERNGERLLVIETKLLKDPNNACLNNWHYRLL